MCKIIKEVLKSIGRICSVNIVRDMTFREYANGEDKKLSAMLNNHDEVFSGLIAHKE